MNEIWNQICQLYGIDNNKEKLLQFVKNWINIQNLSFWNIGQTYLMNKKNDECSLKEIDNCVSDICDKYFSKSTKTEKCVAKERIKEFVNNAIINNRKQQIKYKLIHIKLDVELGMYYYVLEQINTNNCYILFSSGNVMSKEDLYNRLRIKFYKEAKEYIEALPYENIILCGHSLGCVLAQIIGLEIIKENYNFFKERVWIIGSAPFLWLDMDKEEFNRLTKDRMIIFASFVKRGHEIPDIFLYKGSKELDQSKIIVIVRKGKEIIDKKLFNKNNSVYEKFDLDSQIFKTYHNWKESYEPYLRMIV